MGRKLQFGGYAREYEYDNEGNFSDPEGFVDDITDEELLGDILAQKPKESDATQSVVIVDGLPEVGPDRIEKLKSLVKKLFKECGSGTGIISECFPVHSNEKTKGFAILEMRDRA